jgi:hypothetical protein
MKSAQAEFVATLTEIRILAMQIVEHCDDHAGIGPDGINWEHVGDLKRMLALMEEASGIEQVA